MEYYIIIAASIIIILSYLFNWISKETNFPSVLLLIALGIGMQQLISMTSISYDRIMKTFSEIRVLELLGTLGLIMIVLEAALDLKIERKKLPLILKSLLIAFLGLISCTFITGYLIMVATDKMSYTEALIYATPLSILSSAIVIPSVANLPESQKEFHVYESTFSDILGIMLFYFLINLASSTNHALAVGDFTVGLIITIFVSGSLSFLLLYVFQKLEAKVKIFLMISVLILLFGLGKLLHLSSLIIILIFGIILSNHRVFFVGKLHNLIDRETTDKIYDSFHMITMESAFVIRTFFFVIFGFTVALASIINFKVAVISAAILISIYLIRLLILKIVMHRDIKLATFIAPRGLITLLLYYSIPLEFKSIHFNEGVLLFIIIISSLVMTYGLIKMKHTDEADMIEESAIENDQTESEQSSDDPLL
ncbi:cation:proton antiporter [Marinoscillum sp. MHG1-6]|uniref:cation:proton antiporter n=1 Tax=Marinoscillum sp. MHG1-6 TaxID=2959627 RepID=UPI002157C091|nr:cation:proton antiporter [Marinoscillum sp. MHG1-6]